MNPCLILTRNNLALTKRCVDSVRKQDISAAPFIFDNGSTDGTKDWLRDEKIWTYDLDKHGWDSSINIGVSKGWNKSLKHLFGLIGLGRCEHVLVVGNDTFLPEFFLSSLLALDLPFVTGFAVEDMDELRKPEIIHTEPYPDFSAFLIRRDCWEKVGFFNEAMVSWASDCDYHVRAHRAGISLRKANIPFYHVRSSTMRLAPSEERVKLSEQANKDRDVFRSIYGVIPGQPGYDALFSDETFGINKK